MSEQRVCENYNHDTGLCWACNLPRADCAVNCRCHYVSAPAQPSEVGAAPDDYCAKMGDCNLCPNPHGNCTCSHHAPVPDAVPPDIHHNDSERLQGFMRMTAAEIKAVGMVSAATSLEMIGYMRELEWKLRGEEMP